MSNILWVLFCIVFFPFFNKLMIIKLRPRHFYIGFGIASWIRLSYLPHVKIPNAAFWILFAYLLTSLRPHSISLACFLLLVFTRWSVPFLKIHIDPTVPAVGFWLFVTLVPCLIDRRYKRNLSFPAFVCWIATAFIMRDKITYPMSFRWLLAWWLALVTFVNILPPAFPIGWHIFWVPVIYLLGLWIRPGTSIGRFFLWLLVIWIPRFPVYLLYVMYFRFWVTDRLFPFNLFNHKWRQSHPQWFPLSLRACDSATESFGLCKFCDRVMSQSKLVMGSSRYLTRMEEWHDYKALEDLECSVSKEVQSCHLCHIFWYSISKNRRDTLAMNLSSSIGRSSPSSEGSYQSLRPKASALRIKIWEERPLSLYTYGQLYLDEEALGARILVHREELFQGRKSRLPNLEVPTLTCAASTACQRSWTGSSEHIEQAKQWLSSCERYHSLCDVARNPGRELPTRLLYIAPVDPTAPEGSPIVRLELIEGKDLRTEYLALSHCWGGDIPFKLVKKNVDSYCNGIPVSKLPKNMQDAFSITLSLGFSYIWIDSLCIIQDCNEDWKKEAVRMGTVYSNAVCTIASTGSASSNGGCFHDRSTLSLLPCKVGASSLGSHSPKWIYARRDDVLDFQRNVDRSPLNTRAWVQQERLFSRRILHFGAEMIYWECCRRSASELTPNGYVFKKYPDDFQDIYIPDIEPFLNTHAEIEDTERPGRGLSWAGAETLRLRPPPVDLDPENHDLNMLPSSQKMWHRKKNFWGQVLKPSDDSWEDKSEAMESLGFRAAFERLRLGVVPDEQVGVSSFNFIWYEIVESYTRCALTFPTDKLIALHSLVEEIQRVTRYTYLTGLWAQHLFTGLLWFAVDGPGCRLKDMPTWTWASIMGTVALDLFPETSQLKIKLRKILTTVSNPLNYTILPEVSSVQNKHVKTLELKGPLLNISRAAWYETNWYLDIDTDNRQSVRFFPDVLETISDNTALFCLSFCVLHRERGRLLTKYAEQSIQGLVLIKPWDRSTTDTYRRVGFFTTSHMKGSRRTRERLMLAPIQYIRLE